MWPRWNVVESGIPAALTIHPPGLRLPSSKLLTYLLFSTYAVGVIVLAAAILLIILDGARLDIPDPMAGRAIVVTHTGVVSPQRACRHGKTFDYEAH